MSMRRGGAWLLEQTPAPEVFTPERRTEEHRLIAQTTATFVDREVLPTLDRLERKDWARLRRLMARCGELGLLGTNVPDAYDGLDLDKVSALVIVEEVARAASFASTYGGQVNLCILPLVLFGTDDQKHRYLPGLVSGTTIGAYALSEAESGSDALAARTRADRRSDSSWSLTGEKMWITNGGVADLVIVFAKVDGEQFTAFLVERAFPGVSTGDEERKMGLHGSSTTSVLLQDATVPPENVLGEIGQGHKIALNTLNYGRLSLGGMCAGGARSAIGAAARYAAQRRQFGRPIASFGAIMHKLGEMVARTYAAESLVYRTAGLIESALDDGTRDGPAVARVLEQFAIEASIAKVSGSETLDYVLDENIQIHGGNGFVKDYPAERLYRDARVNRIFEGTNEINRLLIPGTLVRRALKGDLPLVAAAKQLQDELLAPTLPGSGGPPRQPLGIEHQAVGALKKLALLVLGTAMHTYGERLSDEQEVLCCAADILIDVYAAESAVLRATQAAEARGPEAEQHQVAAAAFLGGAVQRAEMAARTALAAIAAGDELRQLLAAMRRILRVEPVDTVGLRRRLATAAARRGRYILS